MPKAAPKGQKLTLDYIAKHLSDDDAAYRFLEGIRWPNGPICPRCGGMQATFLEPRNGERLTRTGSKSPRRVWWCAGCRQQFSVLIGTIFEDSKIPLGKWIMATHLMAAGKNGVSAMELHRLLEITYKSAWFMAHRIRKAMEREPMTAMLSGTVEADETYIGGKPKQANNAPRLTRREAARRRMDNKTPVVSLVQRGGEVRSKVIKRVTGANLGKLLKESVHPDATLNTDASHLYTAAGRQFAKHETVDHGINEYVRDDAHVNTAEGYFSQLKRSIDGTHHHVSAHHLPRYLGEFDYRYNTRKMEDGERTKLAIRQAEGKRLRYREPVQNEVDDEEK
jgi:transposase-like protein